MDYVGSVENRVIKFMIFIGIPMLTGFILLGLSVVVMDPNAPTVDVGSASAIFAAGCLPLAALAYFVLSIIVAGVGAAFVQFTPRRLRRMTRHFPEENLQTLRSFIAPVKEKLYFLPGGPGYAVYRERHRLSSSNLKNSEI
ncbi:hypothetical protein M422DRAFT_270031 [Sphaerobolus stellatus SS14]|uniref:Uncharacterized protein n=1 Tax=Sphaerobolus stellatus (strain SS14) TaxID=990650 RepID=A0A0C9UTW0_SPHS4|nr:hypothetical protein M422DRAFT_270031 [Sphaerobolus stellatus SS14]